MNECDLPDETLFEQALQCRTPKERAAYLDVVCAGKPELRRKLEVLLEAHDLSGAFLEATRAAARPTLALDPAPEEKPGTVIGRYKLLQKIGEGGMGVVYMAEQTEPVVRRVALKIIKLGMDTRQVVARFEAERQALALMDHPNIAKVLDAGATDTGRPYFVMELVHGVPITEYCDKNKLSTQQRVELFIPVCQAIQHAHQKGVIHRDIKPSNVMVTLHDGVPVPKVIDFGVAKATNQRLTEKTLFTNYAQMIGTPAYMSPEQAEMSGLDVDTRTDVYALGVLLYELLTGTTPFDAKELLSKGYAEMQRIIVEQEPPKPSTRMSTLTEEQRTVVANHRSTEVSTLGKVLQGDLDWIVMKCLEKDRTRRYETANGVAADLRRHLQNELIAARPPTTGYLLRKLIRRNKLAFAATGAVVGALMIGALVATWQAVRATRAERLATERLQESEAITKFLTVVFQSPDPARDGRTITVAETLDKAVTNLSYDLATQPDLKAHFRHVLAITYEALGLSRQAVPLLEQARDYYLDTYGRDHTNTLMAMNNLAMAYAGAGWRDRAIQLEEELVALFRKRNGPEDPRTLAAVHNLAVSYLGAGRWDEAIKLQEQVLPLIRKVNGPEHSNTIAAMNNLARSYFEANRRDEAIELLEEALSLSRRGPGPEHPGTLNTMYNLGNSYFQAGRWGEAIKLQEEALSLSQKVYGPEHPKTIGAMGSLAESLFKTDRRGEGVKLQEEVLRLSRKVNGPDHPSTLAAMNNLASSYYDVGSWAEALKLQEELVPLSCQVDGPEHPNTIVLLGNLAGFYDVNGRQQAALDSGEQALRLARKVFKPEHPHTITAMKRLADIYEHVGRNEDALKLREDTVQLSGKVNGPDHLDTLHAMTGLYCSYSDAGRVEEALKLSEDVFALSLKRYGREYSYSLVAMNNLAKAYLRGGRPEEALKLMEELVPLYQRVIGQEHPETLTVMNNLASAKVQAGRLGEALDLRKKVLLLRRKVRGPEHGDTIATIRQLADTYVLAERVPEAIALLEEALPLYRKVRGPEHPDTLATMCSLARILLATGGHEEGLRLLTEAFAVNRQDSTLGLLLGALQVWFAKKTDYEATCQRLQTWAADTQNAFVADAAAKVMSLQASNDSEWPETAVRVGHRAVELGRTNTALAGWFYISQGMAEYRNGHYKAAEDTLTTAIEKAGQMSEFWRPLITGTANFYRSMGLFRQGRDLDARQLFTEAEGSMKPLPVDERQPLAGGADHDDIILWLAYKEAKTLLAGPSEALNDLAQ